MYPGGKNLVYQKIINQIPPHNVYIETHLGSGAIMRYKRPAELNIGIDLSLAALELAASFLPGAIVRSGDVSGGTARTGDAAAPSEVTMGAAITRNGEDVITVISNDRIRSASSKAAKGYPIARNDDEHRWTSPQTTSAAALIDTVKSGDVHRYILLQANCLDILQAYLFEGSEFVYSDPPYLRDTRRSQRVLYEFEYSEEDHIDLLTCLVALPCHVAISGYWSELYADLLAGWRSISFTTQTRGGPPAEEWLWMNYPEPAALHDYSYLGDNFRERERIKRKKQRWVTRLQRLDRLERASLLWAIQEEFGDRIAINSGMVTTSKMARRDSA